MVSPRKKSTHLRKYTLIVFVLIAVVGVGVCSFLIHSHGTKDAKVVSKAATNSHTNAVNYKPSTKADSTSNDNRKSSKNPSSTLNNQPAGSTTTPALNPTIVSANINNGILHVGTLVSGTTSGNCTLTATQDTQAISLATSTVKEDVNSYDCGVFNITTSTFPSTGTWNLVLSVSTGTQQAKTSTNIVIPGSD